jgi:predicted Co/Zn/Cd cation transporter (cation efflux family)
MHIWLSTSIRKDTKIWIFSACVKSVLLYGCEAWLVTGEVRRKIQTFVDGCLTIHTENMVAKYNP